MKVTKQCCGTNKLYIKLYYMRQSTVRKTEVRDSKNKIAIPNKKKAYANILFTATYRNYIKNDGIFT